MASNVRVVRVGSRSSQLAIIQTNTIISAMKKVHPEVNFVVQTMETIGDKVLDRALPNIGSTNLFTKELELALAANEVDMIVHSLKDLPTTLSPEFALAAIFKRDDPTDALLLAPKHKGRDLASLPSGCVVGTSSLRRMAQLRSHCPGLLFKSVRGNLNTRLKKLDAENGEYDALVLATSGLERLGWHGRISQRLDPSYCLYAVGQGALAVETRSSDTRMQQLLDCLNHPSTVVCCSSERAFLHVLEGGCSAPVGVCCTVEEGCVKMSGAVLSLDGMKKVNGTISQKLPENWEGLDYHAMCSCGSAVGEQLAKTLLERGARRILEEAKTDNEWLSRQ